MYREVLERLAAQDLILRKDEAAELGRRGIDGPAAELMLDATASRRHRGRCGEIVRALVNRVVYRQLEDWTLTERACAVSELLEDVVGTGGRHDTGVGGASARVGVMALFGAGRRYAHDGGAWDAARDAVLRILAQDAKIIPVESEGDLLRIRFWGSEDVIALVGADDAERYDVRQIALVRRLAGRRLLGMVDNDAPYRLEGDDATWARVYNRAAALEAVSTESDAASEDDSVEG